MLTLFACVLLAGCASGKQSWHDWQQAKADGERLMLVVAEPVAVRVPAADGAQVFSPHYKQGDGARAGDGFDLLMRNPDFPRTHIEVIYIDLTGPDQLVHLKWTGPLAQDGPVGAWRSTPGRGKPEFDCNDVADSNTIDSFCTPKGVFRVAGFADRLTLTPQCMYATWILHAPRYIAMHAHTDLPRKPASSGCVRLPHEAAKLIHNNSIAGITLVSIDGQWERPGDDQ